MPPLPDEVLLLIAGHVSQSELATLCSVSRSFKSIFMPVLYQEARLQKAGWESCIACFERLSQQQNLVKRFYLGREIVVQQPMPKTVHKDISDAIDAFLHKQERLRSV